MLSRKLIICFLLAGVAGCGGPGQVRPQTYTEEAEAAFYEAEEALDDGNYAYALTLYRRVRDNFELSSYAVLSELRLADVHFEQGTYLQAAQAYRQFLQLHPSHTAVPYATFRIGMSYFEDMPSDFFLLPEPYERELGSTRLARRTLGEFLDEYRDDPDDDIQRYAAMAQEAYQEALDRLAGYEFYLAEFYLERERPVAAADHLRSLLEDYPANSLEPEAFFLLARCYVEVADVMSALETIELLAANYPQHRLTERAQAWIAQHDLSSVHTSE